MFLNCIKFGNEALIVKCADLLDNIKYVNLVADVDVKNNLFSLKDVNLEKEMDMALHFVSRNLDESGHNSKPVLFHCFKVSTILYELGYSKDIVISGILHDLLEDTDISYEDICDSFGEKIAGCVLAVTFDSKITDKLEQARKMFLNCIKFGNEKIYSMLENEVQKQKEV